MGGSQARPISSKTVQSYKSAVGVEHKPEKNIFDKIMDSGESYNDAPYSYNDTQEEKLRKVREELFRRIDSHTHAEVTQLISTVATQMNALSSKVELLEITVKTQAALIEQLKADVSSFVNLKHQDNVKEEQEEVWITLTAVLFRLKKMGIVVGVNDISSVLITRKYLSKCAGSNNKKQIICICKDNDDWSKVIKDVGNSKQHGAAKFLISESYYYNALVPYFKKRKEVMENFNKQFENGEGV